MRGTRIHIFVSDEMLAKINAVKGDGVSRSHFVRRAVEAALSGSPEGASPPTERGQSRAPASPAANRGSARPAAPPRASARTEEPVQAAFKTENEYARAMARWRKNGAW